MNQSGVPEQKVQLCIDQGNSSVKAGIFSGDDLLETFRFDKFTRESLNTIEISTKSDL
jgi:pantothenate kinase type III